MQQISIIQFDLLHRDLAVQTLFNRNAIQENAF